MNRKNLRKVWYLLAILPLCFCVVLNAQDKLNLDKMTYPELEVVPKASQRVQMEADNTKKNNFVNFPIELSGAFTLASGLSLLNNKDNEELKNSDGQVDAGKEDDADMIAYAAIGVGAGWIALSRYVQHFYMPYNNCESVKKSSANAKRDELLQERLAEECMANAADVARKMKWYSVVSNLALSAAAASKGGDTTKSIAGLSVLTALSPIFFEHRWIQTYDQHQDYKKRIYGPVVSASMVNVPGKFDFVPGLHISYEF